ncbi:unnamed protein product [Urochloa decumbens]|uniref:F-box domain-containing protein n=1 Tax=Urochloa decumbens TaxID=240449 RepID=A0ABC9F489_9POAL
MAAAATTTTKRARAGGGSGRDRLSALPDELLRRVLFFLPSPQVVRTTVLSRRWMDLWRSVPCIDLNILDFRRRLEVESAGAWEKMKDFTDNLLMLHRAPCLDAFRLHAFFAGHVETRLIDPWVRRAIKDNPLVLQVSVNFTTNPVSFYQLPHLGPSLRRRLRRLQLTGISLDHSFAERLHSWWPYLDDLNLYRCCIGFSCIDSDKLVNLVVTKCTNQPADVLIIRAPRLASLKLDIPYSLDAGNCLVRASISLKHHALSARSEAVLLGSLFSVASFELKGFQTMAVLNEEFDKVPTFDNLRTLSIDSCFLDNSDVHKFKALGRFLQKSPNLERLTLIHFEAGVLNVQAASPHAGALLDEEFDKVPIFDNLRTLSLDWCFRFKTIGRFLQMFPNLERLTLKSFMVSRFVELVEYPKLESLGTLFLEYCDLHDNFGLLRRCLQNSPNLEKLTVRCCKLSDGTKGGERNGNSKKTYSGSRNLARCQCPKLKSTEIIYYQHANVSELVRFLLEVAAPKNTITFTYV